MKLVELLVKHELAVSQLQKLVHVNFHNRPDPLIIEKDEFALAQDCKHRLSTLSFSILAWRFRSCLYRYFEKSGKSVFRNEV